MLTYSADLNPEVQRERAMHAAALAQAQATLALVEQQRIANLIELAKGAAGSDARRAAYGALLVVVGEGFAAREEIHPDIAKGLGL